VERGPRPRLWGSAAPAKKSGRKFLRCPTLSRQTSGSDIRLRSRPVEASQDPRQQRDFHDQTRKPPGRSDTCVSGWDRPTPARPAVRPRLLRPRPVRHSAYFRRKCLKPAGNTQTPLRNRCFGIPAPVERAGSCVFTRLWIILGRRSRRWAGRDEQNYLEIMGPVAGRGPKVPEFRLVAYSSHCALARWDLAFERAKRARTPAFSHHPNYGVNHIVGAQSRFAVPSGASFLHDGRDTVGAIVHSCH